MAYEKLSKSLGKPPKKEPVERVAFLYLEPKQKKHEEQFAQCSTCVMWTDKPKNKCHIHGPSVEVKGSMSCGFYVEGDPMEDGPIRTLVTPDESGLIDASVRCENCVSYDSDTSICRLFKTLNTKVGLEFNADPNVQPKGCCNAWRAH